MQNKARDIARWLQAQHEARDTFRTHDGLRSGTLDLAYDVQDELTKLRCQNTGQSLAGYKIGLTTTRMQEMCGLAHPIAGFVLSGGIVKSPARLIASRFVRLGLECEVAVRLARPLDGCNGRPGLDAIAASIAEIAAAFEVIEDRAADYKALDMLGLISDNSWNAGIVLGPASQLLDLTDLTGRLNINDQLADQGSTMDVLGHPLNSVAWLCEHLSGRGSRIEAGQWIMTGSIVPTRFPKPGDRFAFKIEGLPSAEAEIIA